MGVSILLRLDVTVSNMNKPIELLKIVGGMLFAYGFAVLVGSNLFMVDSPKINTEYLATLHEVPSYMEVQLASLKTTFSNKDRAVQDSFDTFKKQTGATEIAISQNEQKKLVDSAAQLTNPAPNAIFNYVSKGVAASAPNTDGQVVLRFDSQTQQNIEYKRFTRPDGTVLDIMILK